MKNALKRSLSIILAITIIFSSTYAGLNEIDFSELFAVKANAASSGTCGENVTWTLDDDGTLTIFGTGDMTDYSSVSPSPFYRSYDINRVVITDGITSIGDRFFYECINLTSITIPDSVTSIGVYAFGGCTNLTTIVISDTVTSIGADSFYNTGYYNNNRNWENNVLYIGNHLIEAKSTLNGVYEIKAGTKTIATSAFANCTNLTRISIPDTVISIGRCSFCFCSSITSIDIPSSVKSIGCEAFTGCTSLDSINVNENNSKYSSVDGVLFNKDKSEILKYPEGKKGKNYFIIPNSVTSIEDYAFYGCKTLKYIFYEGSQEEWENIKIGMLNDCLQDASIHYSSTGHTLVDSFCQVCDFSLWSYEVEDGCVKITGYNGNDEEIIIPDTINGYAVTGIGDAAFYDCSSITSVRIPDSVISIGKDAFYNTGYYNDITNWQNEVLYIDDYLIAAKDYLLRDSYSVKDGTKTIAAYAFYKCANLTSITIPDSVKNIGESAFQDCKNLTSIAISDSVTNIGDYAFYGCRGFSSITIPKNVTNIGYAAFGLCTNLIKIEWNARSVEDFTSKSDVFYKAGSSKAGITFIIGDGVEYIPQYLCSVEESKSSPNIKNIVFSNSIKSIGKNAFVGCSSIEAIYITDLENWCHIDFENNTSNPLYYAANLYLNKKLLSDLVIPKSVTKIGSNTFRNYTKLYSVTILNNVINIDDYAFYGCVSLTSVEISDSVISIGKYAFSHTNLKSFKIPNSITYIEQYTFYKCANLTSITIPDSVTGIGSDAFSNYSNLSSLTIPDSVTNIGYNAFFNCSNLKYVFYEGSLEQWWDVVIGVGNTSLDTRFFHYNTTSHLSDNWIIDEKATVYSPGSKHKECTECGEIFDTAEIPQLKAGKPKLKSIENTEYGVLTKWSKVTGADKYRVYRKTSKSDWKYIGTTSKTYYTDKTAKSGTKYYYAVKSQNEAGNSSLSSSLSKYYLADPTLKTPSSSKTGVKLTWSKVSGADGYMVYRKTSSGSYSRIATVKGSTKVTYTDKSAKKGKKYTYKVKAYKSKTYSAYSNTKTITDKY